MLRNTFICLRKAGLAPAAVLPELFEMFGLRGQRSLFCYNDDNLSVVLTNAPIST